MASGFQVSTAAGTVASAVDSVKRGLQDRGVELFAEIDHGAGAVRAGLTLGDEILLVFGSPVVGTKLMQEDRRAGLDLPLRMLVWSEDGSTRVGYSDPHALADHYNLANSGAVLDGMSALLAGLAEAAAK